MDFDQWVVGPFRSVEDGFELCWGYVVEVAVQPAVLCQWTQLSVASSTSATVFHGPVRRGPVDQFGLVVAVHRLREGVIEAVTDGPDRRRGTDLSETLAIPQRGELRSRIGVTSQPRQA